MTYRGDIQLFFDIASVRLAASSRAAKLENSPIRLTYIGDDEEESRPRPLTTEKRFFLQIMRAHLQCLVQHQTGVKELLDFISGSWTKACAVSDAVTALERAFVTDASIISDEKLRISAMMLLPELKTKINVSFDLHALVGNSMVDTQVAPLAKVAYGERYNEPKMAEFLANKVGHGFEGWVESVQDLKQRLTAKGRKGARV
jgi:kinetochore protein Spc7/SPC105